MEPSPNHVHPEHPHIHQVHSVGSAGPILWSKNAKRNESRVTLAVASHSSHFTTTSSITIQRPIAGVLLATRLTIDSQCQIQKTNAMVRQRKCHGVQLRHGHVSIPKLYGSLSQLARYSMSTQKYDSEYRKSFKVAVSLQLSRLNGLKL